MIPLCPLLFLDDGQQTHRPLCYALCVGCSRHDEPLLPCCRCSYINCYTMRVRACVSECVCATSMKELMNGICNLVQRSPIAVLSISLQNAISSFPPLKWHSCLLSLSFNFCKLDIECLTDLICCLFCYSCCLCETTILP